LLGGLTGHRDDLDDLLGGEGGRFAGPGGVVEDHIHQPAELFGGLLLLDTLQDLPRFEPAVTPGAHGHAGQSQLPGHRFDARLNRQGQDEQRPADQSLVGGLLTLNPSEHILLCRGDMDRSGSWSSHQSALSTKDRDDSLGADGTAPLPFRKIIIAALY
jgi:hypothetical protein